MEYLVSLIGVLVILMVLKWRFKVRLFHRTRQTLLFASLCLVVGGILDSFMIVRGYWIFGDKYLIGVRIGVMPIEEYLFMLVFGFFVATVYRIVADRMSTTPLFRKGTSRRQS